MSAAAPAAAPRLDAQGRPKIILRLRFPSLRRSQRLIDRRAAADRLAAIAAGALAIMATGAPAPRRFVLRHSRHKHTIRINPRRYREYLAEQMRKEMKQEREEEEREEAKVSVEVKTEVKTEVKAEVKEEVKVEVKLETKVEVRMEEEMGTKVEVKTEVKEEGL